MIVMGRKTWESLGIRKPLPKRTNVVISSKNFDYGERKEDTQVLGFNSVHQFTNSHTAWKTNDQGEIMVIGGAQIYEQFYKRADRIYLTTFYFDESELITPDTFMPSQIVNDVMFEQSDNWKMIDQSFALDKPNPDGTTSIGAVFATYERTNAPVRLRKY
jgi:dihydrofolate reductase